MPAEGLNREALSWIDGAESPFFVYLHYMDVHFPYDPPAPYRTLYSAERSDLTPLRLNGPGSFDAETIAYSTALYDAQINYWDDHFRQLMEELEKAGRMDDTIVVIVADHGEEFGEHAGFGHGFTTYPEVLHVPLVVVYGDFVAKGVVRHDLVRLIDIAPTIRGLAGLEPGLAAAEGSDLFAASGVEQTERVLYSEASSGHGPRSVRTSKYQLIFNSDDESWEFYRLGHDPRALRNRYGVVSRADGELLAELEAALLQRMEPTERAVESESVELGDETIEELEGLGYLQ
jgi:arylsulfatase A-like enzyme